MKSITIPQDVTTIGRSAFSRCNKLTDIFCKATTPPTLSILAFDDDVVQFIYVPQASVEAYQSADGWSGYASQIVGYDF